MHAKEEATEYQVIDPLAPPTAKPRRIRPPRPEVFRAWLVSSASEAIGRPRTTLHKYVETIPVAIKGPEPMAWAHVYQCLDTGIRRRWGLYNRTVEVAPRTLTAADKSSLSDEVAEMFDKYSSDSSFSADDVSDFDAPADATLTLTEAPRPDEDPGEGE